MIRYLLDTDTASFILKRYSATLEARYLKVLPSERAISAVSYAELLFGLESTPAFHPARIKVADFVKSNDVLDWPMAAAAIYASIRYRTQEQPLQDRDIFIAAHAIALDATIVTNNTRHFSRMGGGLRYENWLE